MEGVWSYIARVLTLEHGTQPVPFDGVLFDSWAMIAEARFRQAAPCSAQALTDLDDDGDKSEQAYEGKTSDVLTVLPQLGEPIPEITIRAIKR